MNGNPAAVRGGRNGWCVMDTTGLIWFAAAWFIGGFANGVTGFGAALAAMPFVLMGMDLKLAVPACSLMVMVASLEQLWRHHGVTDRPRLRQILIGAVPGALAGGLALRFLPSGALRAFLGLLLVCYAFWGLFLEDAKPPASNRAWAYAAGFFSTLSGTALSFNGPPLAMYAAFSGWNKETGKTGLAAAFVITCAMMLLAQILAGMQSAATVTAMLVGTPCSALGAAIGFRATRRLGDTAYRRVLFLFIGLAGSKILFGFLV